MAMSKLAWKQSPIAELKNIGHRNINTNADQT